MLKIGHDVVRPGKYLGDAPVTIPVPEELETVPGVPMNQREVDWYAREYPLETMNITERASRDWANSIRDQHVEMREIRKEHDKLNKSLLLIHGSTDDILDKAASEDIFSRASEPKKIVIIEGAGHGLSESAEEVFVLLKDFIQKHAADDRS